MLKWCTKLCIFISQRNTALCNTLKPQEVCSLKSLCFALASLGGISVHHFLFNICACLPYNKQDCVLCSILWDRTTPYVVVWFEWSTRHLSALLVFFQSLDCDQQLYKALINTWISCLAWLLLPSVPLVPYFSICCHRVELSYSCSYVLGPVCKQKKPCRRN